MHRKYLAGVTALVVSLSACHDATTPVGAEPLSRSQSSAPQGQDPPTRAEESPHNSVHISDDRLWQLLDEGRGTALVGLKAPGQRRGVWRAEWVVSRADWRTGLNALRGMPGITVVREVPPLPVVEVRIDDAESLRKLRKLPFVDYVENATIPRAVLDEAIALHGPESAFASNCKIPEAYDQMARYTEYGDVYSYSFGQYYAYHKISLAWSRSAGDNIRVALLDTGMDPQQSQFTNSSYFNPRPWEYSRVIDGEVGSGFSDPCGHGTRMAGVIAAPNDGRSVVGVAWKSDLRVISVASRSFSTDLSYYDYIISVDPARAYDGIRRAMGDYLDLYTGQLVRSGTPSHIITMAWKSYNDPVNMGYPNTVADLIRYYYYGPGGPLFVAAIGTLRPAGLPNAVFPAELDEVVAVVALDPNGGRNIESHYGPGAELAAYIPAATVNVPSQGGHSGITKIMGASGASAVMSGIAAQVWSQYPWMTNSQVRARLKASADHPHNHVWGDGYGWVDAYRAVGGFSRLEMQVRECTTMYEPQFDAMVLPTGDGPFTYSWGNGSTGQTATYTAAAPGDSVHVWVSVKDQVENRTRQVDRWVRTATIEDPDFTYCLSI